MSVCVYPCVCMYACERVCVLVWLVNIAPAFGQIG